MRMGARIVMEQKGRMRDTVDRRTLGKHVGNTWSEVDYARLTAMTVSETTNIDDNPEQISDNLITITPTDRGIHVLYTDRTADNILAEGTEILRSGVLGMNAVLRALENDGITLGRSATTDLGTAGNPLVASLVRHAKARISANTTENNADGPYHFQHHGFALADIEDEMSAPLGTYEITSGVSADVIMKSYTGAPRMLGGAFIHENNLLSIDSSDDSEGFMYATQGIILVEARGARTEVRRRPNIGGGSTSVYMYFEAAWGQRSPGNWLFSITADATAPA
jgi:hypothetical protein